MLVDLTQCTLSKCSKWVLASDPSLSKTKGTQLSIDVLKCAYPPLRFGSIQESWQDPSIFRSNSKQVKNHASQWVLHYITVAVLQAASHQPGHLGPRCSSGALARVSVAAAARTEALPSCRALHPRKADGANKV